MSSPFRLFRTAQPIDAGQGASGRRAWRQIADIMARVGQPSEQDDFERALSMFQRGVGLKPDGIVNPGGPMEDREDRKKRNYVFRNTRNGLQDYLSPRHDVK